MSELSREIQEKILEDHAHGLKAESIRRKLGIKRSQVLALVGKTEMKSSVGRITKAQKSLIKKMVLEGKSDEDIAISIDKLPDTIKKFRHENNLITDDMKDIYRDHTLIVEKLRRRPFWPLIKKQMSAVETAFFEDRWANIIIQFKEDVTAIEEGHIQSLIFLEIREMRTGIEQQQLKEKIEQYDTQINDIYNLPKDERDEPKLMWLTSQREVLASASKVNTNEIGKILDSQAKFSTMLKSTRDQRLDRIDDSKTSWQGVLRYFEESRNRDRESVEAELRKKAMENQFVKMAEGHIYADGQFDLAILSPETLEISDRLEKEIEQKEQEDVEEKT